MSGRRAGDHTGLANDAQAALLAARLRHAAMSHRSPTSASTLMGGSPGEFYTSLPTYTSAHHATAAFNVLLQEARAGRPHPGSLLRSGAWGGELRPPIRTLYSDVYQGMRLGHDPLALREIIKAEPELAQQQDSEGATLLHWACFFGAHEKLVEAILLANPGAARVPSRHDGSLPMHVAASWGRSATVISLLFAAFPGAVSCLDASGHTPQQKALENNHGEIVPVLVPTEHVGTSEFRRQSTMAQDLREDNSSTRWDWKSATYTGLSPEKQRQHQSWRAEPKQSADSSSGGVIGGALSPNPSPAAFGGFSHVYNSRHMNSAGKQQHPRHHFLTSPTLAGSSIRTASPSPTAATGTTATATGIVGGEAAYVAQVEKEATILALQVKVNELQRVLVKHQHQHQHQHQHLPSTAPATATTTLVAAQIEPAQARQTEPPEIRQKQQPVHRKLPEPEPEPALEPAPMPEPEPEDSVLESESTTTAASRVDSPPPLSPADHRRSASPTAAMTTMYGHRLQDIELEAGHSRRAQSDLSSGMALATAKQIKPLKSAKMAIRVPSLQLASKDRHHQRQQGIRVASDDVQNMPPSNSVGRVAAAEAPGLAEQEELELELSPPSPQRVLAKQQRQQATELKEQQQEQQHLLLETALRLERERSALLEQQLRLQQIQHSSSSTKQQQQQQQQQQQTEVVSPPLQHQENGSRTPLVDSQKIERSEEVREQLLYVGELPPATTHRHGPSRAQEAGATAHSNTGSGGGDDSGPIPPRQVWTVFSPSTTGVDGYVTYSDDDTEYDDDGNHYLDEQYGSSASDEGHGEQNSRRRVASDWQPRLTGKIVAPAAATRQAPANRHARKTSPRTSAPAFVRGGRPGGKKGEGRSQGRDVAAPPRRRRSQARREDSAWSVDRGLGLVENPSVGETPLFRSPRRRGGRGMNASAVGYLGEGHNRRRPVFQQKFVTIS